MPGIVTLLSDFGTSDPYVGEMKGRMLAFDRELRFVDLTHAVPPGDVAAGAFLLSRAWRTFPEGAVHLVVVDPGVGTRRNALAVTSAGHWFVGPDNGVLSMAAPEPDKIWRLDPARVEGENAMSATFHGRDLFAPAAARLASGADPDAFGDEVQSMDGLEPVAERVDDRLYAPVLWVDHFGNAVTGIGADVLEDFGAGIEVRVGGLRIRELHRTFADVPPLTPLAYLGSAGTLEIAVRDGDLSERYGIGRGTQVELRPVPRS